MENDADIISENPALSCASSDGFQNLETSQNLENYCSNAKKMPRWKHGNMDRLPDTLIHRNLLVMIRGSIKTATMLGLAMLKKKTMTS